MSLACQARIAQVTSQSAWSHYSSMINGTYTDQIYSMQISWPVASKLQSVFMEKEGKQQHEKD